MGRHNRPKHGHYARGNIRQKSGNVSGSYFVPSFAIRRRAEQNDKLENFLTDIRSEVGRGYSVYGIEDVAMTVIQQSQLIRQLREARERPDRSKIENLAKGIGAGISRLLDGTEQGLDMPLGILSRFGSNGRRNKIGIVPRGWKGHHARYAREDGDGERLPLGLIVDESIFSVGSIATAFSENKRFVINGLARTPHMTFLKKVKGDITETEFRNISGSIMEVVSDMDSQDLRLEDPVIYAKYAIGESAEAITIR